MKKLAITIAAVFATLNIFAQGTVNFQNNASSYVYDDTKPVANTLAAAGTSLAVGLYWAPVNAAGTQPDPSTFTLEGTTHVGLLIAGVYRQPGIYAGGTITISGIVPAGGMGWFQVKSWDLAFGQTFDAAAAAGGRNGVSGIIKLGTGDPTVTPPGVPGTLYAVGPIHLNVVPEPAIMGLGLLGGAALLLLRRRK